MAQQTNKTEEQEFLDYLAANPLDDDAPVSSPYPKGFLEKMSMKQLKRERIKQIGIADDADLGSKDETLAQSRLTYVLCEIDIRQCKGKSEITR